MYHYAVTDNKTRNEASRLTAGHTGHIWVRPSDCCSVLQKECLLHWSPLPSLRSHSAAGLAVSSVFRRIRPQIYFHVIISLFLLVCLRINASFRMSWLIATFGTHQFIFLLLWIVYFFSKAIRLADSWNIVLILGVLASHWTEDFKAELAGKKAEWNGLRGHAVSEIGLRIRCVLVEVHGLTSRDPTTEINNGYCGQHNPLAHQSFSCYKLPIYFCLLWQKSTEPLKWFTRHTEVIDGQSGMSYYISNSSLCILWWRTSFPRQ